MRDRELRAAMHVHLRNAHGADPDTLIVDEFSIDGLDRVDLATINGAMTGYELKSASDKLGRLERQAPSYSRVMDYLYLVTADSHLANARAMIPNWWGIITAKENAGAISLRQRRRARQNPVIDAYAVARLLWRDEALTILTAHALDAGFRTRTREELCVRLAQQLAPSELRREVRAQIKARREWRESPERLQSGATSPLEDMIPRFLARRLRMPPR